MGGSLLLLPVARGALCAKLLLCAALCLAHTLPRVLAEQSTLATGIRVDVDPAPRQVFKGFGWSMVRGGGSPFHGPLGNFSQPVREKLLTLLCEDLGTSVVRLWWTPEENVPPQPGRLGGDAEFFRGYVDSGASELNLQSFCILVTCNVD